jgi:predicted ribosomally synthesized peptide with SipW-like signal peptide
MNKKKSIAVAIVLALVLLIGGMLAYFTDKDTKTNTFTIGDDIEIT